VGGWGGVEPYVTLDTGDAPHVLALEIGAGGKAVDLEGECVFTGLGVGCDVEFGRELGVLRVAHSPTVDIKVAGGFNGSEVKVDVFSLPVGGNVEGVAIGADRVVVVGNVWGLGAAFEGELVRVVNVVGNAVAKKLPIGWDGDSAPGGVIVSWCGEVLGSFRGGRDPVEFPVSVQKLVVVLGIRGGCEGFIASGGGYERGAGGLFVDSEDRGVFPFRSGE